jgi:thiol-disulfide isomerase/thioredoxin
MKLFFLFKIYFCITLISCNNNSSIDKNTIVKESDSSGVSNGLLPQIENSVKITIEDKKIAPLSFYYIDDFDNLSTITSNAAKAGIINKTIQTNDFVILNYSIKELRIPFVIKNGDSIVISFTETKKPFVKYSRLNNENKYNTFTKLSDSSKSLFTTSNLFLINPKSIDFQNSYISDSLFFANKLITQQNNDVNYYQLCLDYLQCQYHLQKSILDKNNINLSFLENENNLKFHNYRNMLTEYEFYLNSKKGNSAAQIMENSYKSAIQKKGQIKDYLLFYTLSWMKSKNQSLFKKYFPYFLNECKNEDFVKNLDEEMARVSNLNATKEIINYSTNDKFSMEEILKQNKGKIIYIDFWASWCMPCRASMQELPKIWAKYSGSPISFVYISIDEKKGAWEAAVKEENLNNQNHNYLISNPKNSSLLKQYSIREIPRYMIFDKEGKVVQLNAPSPESKEFEIEISKLIEAK